MRHSKTIKTAGFSLIQMAVLVAVAGIIFVSLLPGGRQATEAGKQALTRQHMEAIEKAMQGFMTTNLRRPCPADASKAATDQYFGAEAAYPGVCTGSTPAANLYDQQTETASLISASRSATVAAVANLAGIHVGSHVTGTHIPANTFVASIDPSAPGFTMDNAATATISESLTFSTFAAGAVPTKTLGLPNEFALDGYGRRIMYIVDNRATRAYSTADVTGGTGTASSGAPKSCFDLQSQGLPGAIDIYDDKGTTNDDTIADYPKDHTMWALISYGKAGHGAFPAEGSSAANRIDAGGGDAAVIPDAGQINAFIAPNASSFATATFTGKLVQQPPDADSPYNTTVWYSEDTKNTCCVGKACSLGFDFRSTSGSGTTDNVNGVSVATGDINGDGITDLVLGFYGYAVTNSNRTYVIFGRKTGWPITLGTNNLIADINNTSDGTYGFYIKNTGNALSTAGFTNFGKIIAVGDINQDGYDDIAINGSKITLAFGERSLGTNVAKNGVFAGTTTLPPFAAAAVSTYGTLIKYTPSGTPQAIATGDIQGDGYKSLIFSGGSTSNWVWVIKDQPIAIMVAKAGGAAPKSWDTTAADATLFKFTTTDPANFPLGHGYFSIASGDVNGDGLDDIVIGDSTATGGAGKVYVLLTGLYPAAAGGPPAAVDITGVNVFRDATSSYITVGGSTGLGLTVAVADMNNDGYKDIITSDTNNVYIYYGKATASWAANTNTAADVTINTSAARPAWITNADTAFPAVIKTGDINGDGRQDLLFGTYDSATPDDCTKGAHTGSIYVLFQPITGWPGSPRLFKATGTACDATEMNLGAIFDGGGINCDSANGGTPSLCGFRIDGRAAADYAYIPAVADFNADGKNDIFVAAPGYSAPTGIAYCILGRKTVTWDSVFDLNNITSP